MKYLLISFLLNSFLFLSQDKTITPKEIASTHFNSIVKILLFDSIAEKKNPGTGYYGRGSGFIVSEDGIIFTNKHVVDLALGKIHYTFYDHDQEDFIEVTKIYNPNLFHLDIYEIYTISRMSLVVQVFDKPNENVYTLYQAKLISIDTSNYDGAIIKITNTIDGRPVKEKFNPVILGNSDSTSQGEDLCVYGFPQQYSGGYETMLSDQSTMLAGKHAGHDNVVNSDYGFIKTDIPISSGNSGGPVFNGAGLVIGIATAASSKTGNGFISKINGMYNLAKNDFLLLSKLKLAGLHEHTTQKKINLNGIINNPNYLIPRWVRINKFNLDQKYTRRFVGGFWFIKAGIAVYQNDSYRINKPENNFLQTNDSSKLQIKNKTSFFFDVGKIFSLWRINDYNKLSIDWSMLNFTNDYKDWSNSSLINDTIKSTIAYNSKQSNLKFGSKIGLSYSSLINRRTQLDFYYKVGYYFTISSSSIGTYTAPLTSWDNKQINVFENSLLNTFGINIHLMYFFIGLEYTIGTSNGINFYDILDAPFDSGDGSLIRSQSNINGKKTINNLNFTIGFPLYNKNRWKKFSY